MIVCKTLQANRELHVTASNNILNIELGKLGVEAASTRCAHTCAMPVVSRLHFSHILPSEKIKEVVFGSRIRIMTAAKRYRTKRISAQTTCKPTDLGVTLCIPSVQYNGLEVETAIEVDCGNYFVM